MYISKTMYYIYLHVVDDIYVPSDNVSYAM